MRTRATCWTTLFDSVTVQTVSSSSGDQICSELYRPIKAHAAMLAPKPGSDPADGSPALPTAVSRGRFGAFSVFVFCFFSPPHVFVTHCFLFSVCQWRLCPPLSHGTALEAWEQGKKKKKRKLPFYCCLLSWKPSDCARSEGTHAPSTAHTATLSVCVFEIPSLTLLLLHLRDTTARATK